MKVCDLQQLPESNGYMSNRELGRQLDKWKVGIRP